MIAQTTTITTATGTHEPSLPDSDPREQRISRALLICMGAANLAGLLDFQSYYFIQGGQANAIYTGFRFGVGLLAHLICLTAALWILWTSHHLTNFKTAWHRKFAFFAGTAFSLIAVLNIYSALLTRLTP